MESKKSESMMHEKLQLLRSVTNSPSVNGSSIVVDASNYIQQLKQRIQKLNQEIFDNGDDDQPSSSTLHHQHNGNPVVTVETLEKGFLINVVSLKNCPGLLVSVLEAFEEIGLNVVEARVSCTDSFRLQAVGGGGQVRY
ncbi:Transcription factor SCREAM2 [Linum grandiflorum]